jgi:hypothetical protein
MRPTQNLEELIKRLHFKTGANLHERTISDALQAQAKSKEIKSASVGLITWRIILKSPIIKIALASLIILTVSFFVYNSSPVEKVDTVNVTKVTESPAELLTVASLNMAYRRGGIKAIEKQCDEAIDKLGPQPAKMTAKELLAEFNGT